MMMTYAIPAGRALAAMLLLALLGLGACDAARPGRPGEARAPGVYFHNDIVVFGAVGGGSNGR